MITNERAEVLAKYLAEDKERLEALLAVSAEEAVAKINADGYDFTAEELVTFGEKVDEATNMQGELNENDLDSVAGGSVLPWWIIGRIGYEIGKRWARR